ncbi:MAG: IS1380 family transposase [Tannerella sp.]|nr:IS1380 family transposase [Tannerella sp.]
MTVRSQGSNRGYDPIQMFVQFMASVWCGANGYAQLDVTRFDSSIARLFGWERMTEHKAFQRYFKIFDIPTSHAVFGGLYKWFFSNLKSDNFTMDIDSSVLTRYGEQEGAKKGCNKQKPGRNSQHPIIAFIADVEFAANFWLRSGDSHSANNFKAFLEETLSFVADKKIGLLCLDSGFYAHDILTYPEERPSAINYIVAVRMYSTIRRAIAPQRSWMNISKGIDMVEFEYPAKDWPAPGRMAAVRQKIEKRPKAAGKQLSLFADDWEIEGYRYSCYVTNPDLPPAEVWRLYRGRANCENRIKELKYDYGLDKINEQSFDATEATLLRMTIAYNFMSLVRQVIIGGKIRHRLSTLRYKLPAIHASIENAENKVIINMALQMNRRLWIRKL